QTWFIHMRQKTINSFFDRISSTKAPIMPSFSNGSACFLIFRCTTSDCLDETGHVVVSRQSSYFDKKKSGSNNSRSFCSKKNSPFEGVNGQYINLEGSYVVSSK